EIMGAAAKEAVAGTKPVIAIACQSGRWDDGVMAEIREANVPALQGSREALRAISHLARFQNAGKSRSPAKPAISGDVALPQAWDNGLVAQGPLFDLLEGAGLRVTRNGTATNAADAQTIAAELGGPVVMKIDTPRVVHKSDIGGVALDVTADT